MINSIKLSNYFELVHPKYTYIQIIPHKSIRNYNSSNIIKSISTTYKSINKRIHKENKKLFIETNFKLSYIIDISCSDCCFYFLVPICYKNIIIDKINEIWKKATIKELETIENLNNPLNYALFYKKDDCLSLKIDKKSNNPLNQIINVADIMKDNDKIRIVYNFLPSKQSFWKDKHNEMLNKIENNKPLEKNIMSYDYILKSTLNIILSILQGLTDVINDFLGNTNNTDMTIFNQLSNILNYNNKKVLSKSTLSKKDSTIINTQILISSQSNDNSRQLNNILSTCNSYSSISEDNELIYKRIKNNPNIQDYDFNIPKSLCSTDECQNFVQIPADNLLREYKINHIKTEESVIPIELQNGTKLLGNSTFKGKITPVYLENEYNNGSLPLSAIGSQGSGKTTFIKHYVCDCEKANESVVIIDIIKNCELSSSIEKVIPKDKLVIVDLSKEDCLQGIGYNEIKINNSMSDYQKCKLASLQSQQLMNLIDSISTGEPLSSRMRRFLNSASNIMFVQGYSSVKDVINCLQHHEFRNKCINNLPLSIKKLLSDEVETLLELNEMSKTTKNNPISEICGTKDSKIEYILDRINMLREDFKLKYMYSKSLDKNIDLVDCMNQGKIVLIKMREDEFPTKIHKNIMVTYWISKVWLACQLRGSIQNKPLRTNIIIDEVFQAPTSMNMLNYILPQSRKFGCKFIFSSQETKQIDTIFDILEASGSSFMLLTGSTEKDFNYFKSKFTNFEYEDLRDMEQFSAMCLVKYSKGYSNFIVKLPYNKQLDIE